MTVSTVPTLKQVPLWPIQWPQQGQPWQNRELLQQLAIETPSSCCGWIWSGIPRVPPRGSRVTRGIAFAGYLALWLGTAPCLPWLRHCESIASTPQPSPLAPTGGDALKCCDWCASCNNEQCQNTSWTILCYSSIVLFHQLTMRGSLQFCVHALDIQKLEMSISMQSQKCTP